ncbi:MAG: hypothetical protein MJ090_05500 [Clostridia bacterium]|nr:hypothetical protein [Clostridia bacterium]
MKKLLIIPLLFCFFICGCAANNNVEVVLGGLRFNAVALTDKENYLFRFETNKDLSKIDVFVESPEELKGINYTFENERVFIGYKGIKTDKSQGDFCGNNVVNIIRAVISDLNGKTAQKSDKNYFIEGSVGKSGYSALISPSGLPVSIDIGKPSFKVQFEKITVVK